MLREAFASGAKGSLAENAGVVFGASCAQAFGGPSGALTWLFVPTCCQRITASAPP